MGALEILMFWVVGFSVLVFTVVDYLDLVRKSRKDCREAGLVYVPESKTDEIESETLENSPDDLANPGGASCTFDDWEEIERTELERAFDEAVVFVSDKNNADKIDGDLKLNLYALQKAALQGPCHGSQPRPFNFSARTKWRAWQKLGNISPEMAMDKYVNLLAKAIPGWKVMKKIDY